MLIDAIVETICRCSEDRDNAVQLEVIKVSKPIVYILFAIVYLFVLINLTDFAINHDCSKFKGARAHTDGGF